MTPEAWIAMTTRIEMLERATQERHEEAVRMMSERSGLLEHLAEVIGRRSDDGKGGSGLIGEMARLQRDVGELLALKNQGIGLIIAVSIFGVLIVLGIRQWIAGIIGVHP